MVEAVKTSHLVFSLANVLQLTKFPEARINLFDFRVNTAVTVLSIQTFNFIHFYSFIYFCKFYILCLFFVVYMPAVTLALFDKTEKQKLVDSDDKPKPFMSKIQKKSHNGYRS